MAVTESVCLSDEQQAVAVREVAQVYELIKTQQPLLLVHQQPQQLAHGLLNHAMRALNVALSVMNQPHASSSSAAAAAAGHHFPVMTMIKAESTPANSPAADVSDNHVAGKARRSSPAKRRRINCEDKSSWVYHTVVPHEDGYQWRKYGEKKIQGTHFTRSYFRCTYRDDRGCLATKQIQQEDKNDPPMFQVTYSNEHTCTTTRLINNTNNNPAALHSLTANPNGHPDDDSDDTILTKMIKQEQQAAWLPSPPPDLTTISNNFDETPGLHMGQQLETTVMEEALGLGADLDDPYFYDPNLLLIYENLMNCY
ncbi:probable WRKY transcription factor 63 isoform X2 [Oryza glaberrima]|uniref:probable WRKY transcription factor 63 isoform X2 n=1 Tax=Oryza glaberrima TaxID=4538 RepID=UPI00224C376F|nr:probable WRKY transcription factor 63 isoform X2 [Oryza glaberrima]